MEDSAPEAASAPIVPGYDVGRLLGRGATASVWLATHRATGREYALKCFDTALRPDRGALEPEGPDPSRPDHPDAEAALRREVSALAAVEHDHVLRVRAVIRVEDPSGAREGLVLDYAAGGSVAQLLAARGTLTAGETVTILTPIAQALAYLHARGFTHGDVSPGNVLFTEHGKPLLADLGFARMVADPGSPAAGTAGFRDPSPVDAMRVGLQPGRDVYSLAALGWFCLTGKAPGPAKFRPPLSLLAPAVPAALAAALEAGLAEDWRQRPTASELAGSLYRSAEPAAVDLSASAHPSVRPQLLTRPADPGGSSWWGRRFALRWKFRARLRARRPAAVAVAPRAGRAGRRSQAARANHVNRASLHGRQAAPRRTGLVLAAGLLAALAWTAGPSLAGYPAQPGFAPPGPVQAGPAQAGPVQSGPSQASPQYSAADDARTTEAAASLPASAAGNTEGPGAAVPAELRALLDSTDPVVAVRGLARLRALAFGTGQHGLLAYVNAPGSAAEAADSVIRSRLAAGGVPAGVPTGLARVEAVPGSQPGRAVVAITAVASPDAPAGRQAHNGAGPASAGSPGVAAVELRLVLAVVEGRWRVQEILAGGT